ncbi:MAG: hypothetical protein HOP32_14760 [Nitrospira sp.]|nr:hypothetical protein [Nitrospira sp.]
MPTPFYPATAEQVVSAVEAVIVNGKSTKPDFVAEFSDLTKSQSEAGLKLAVDLKLLAHDAGKYSVESFLCRFLVTPNQSHKASVLRLVLESFEPFVVFRERLIATGSASTAAQQTKVALSLEAHREEIKDTLISLGTYSHALLTEGGGRYKSAEPSMDNTLHSMSQACSDAMSAEYRIREQLGQDAASFVSRNDVIVPLSDGLLRAAQADSRGAVLAAGNAIESYLDSLASHLSPPIPLTGATGINAKLEKLQQTNTLPKKLINVGKYLGHIRNAADHGIDPETGASWTIRRATGLEYVYVACSFISSSYSRTKGKPPEI